MCTKKDTLLNFNMPCQALSASKNHRQLLKMLSKPEPPLISATKSQ